MANTAKLTSLVNTVRELNWELRPKINNVPGGDPEGNDLHVALSELRENELRTSQMIRGMSLAETAIAGDDPGRVVEHADPKKISSRQVLSEFATARESILSIVRSLPDEEWEAIHETPFGERSYDGIIDDLIESDEAYLKRIKNASA